jgi:hypothetical protein
MAWEQSLKALPFRGGSNHIGCTLITTGTKTMSLQIEKIPTANQISLLDLIPEGPITTISPETLESILFFTNQSRFTRLVSRKWNDLTFAGIENFKKREIKQTIRLIIDKLNLDTHAQFITDLAEIQDAHHSLTKFLVTPSQIQRLFLISKGVVIGILRKLPEEKSDQLQIALSEELPDSMKDLFVISKLNLKRIKDIEQDTYFTLFQSCRPLSITDRGKAFSVAIRIKNIIFVKLLLADGPISVHVRGWAVCKAAKKDNLELAKLLLTNGPILIDDRGWAVYKAAKNNNQKLVELLLANGPIPQFHLLWAAEAAEENDNPELVQLLRETRLNLFPFLDDPQG